MNKRFLSFIFGLLFINAIGATEPSSVNVMENKWHEFQCDYDPSIDQRQKHELALDIRECTGETRLAMEKSQLMAVAVVFGKISAEEDPIKSTLMNNQEAPFYYANPDNRYVKEGLVEVVSGDVNSIKVKVKAVTKTSRLCITCNQITEYRDFSTTKKVSLKIIYPPTASAKVNNQVQPSESSPTALDLNQAVNIECEGNGPEQLSVKLLKNKQVIAESATSEKSLTHVISRASRDSAGIYECQAVSDLPLLVSHGNNTGTVKFVLAVRFPPEFEVSEIIRYTQIGNKENIRIKVPSYPEASMSCSPSHDVSIRQSYNDREFVTEYEVTLTNLESVQKETVVECTASNDLGERQLRIRLTAKAPRPEILSSPETKWSNSYKLEWQHDQNATIDYYEVKINYKDQNGQVVNETDIRFSPTAQAGHMALVDGKQQNGKLIHSGVLLQLKPDTDHDVQLKSCNQHGCSDPSAPISVRTPARTATNYNDPKNPTNIQPTRSAPIGGPAARLIWLSLSLCLLLGAVLL